MNFRESKDYLYSLGNEVEAMKLGLENIRALLDTLGGPHKKYKKVQVAGTNGKGSVCVFLDSICRAAEIRTGLYTSPHLTSITERIKIDGAEISETDFARLATIVRERSEKMLDAGELRYRPTFFEQVTAIALLAFADANVELVILETGLGGRLDATTAADAEIVAITRIDLDHQEYLGDTVEEIAAEKAAIIRPGVTAILAHQAKNVERVLLGRCREVGVAPVWATTDIHITRDPGIEPMLVGTFATEKDNYSKIDFFNMLGEHQIENAAVALAIAEQLGPLGFEISNFDICTGLGTAQNPGRLEHIGNFLLDGAHNIGGITALVNFLDEFYSGRPITLVFGAMRDKNVPAIAKMLWPRAARIILTQPSNSRAMTADELRPHLPASISRDNVHSTDSVDHALRTARELTPRNGIILVTGSLYLVGEVRGKLEARSS